MLSDRLRAAHDDLGAVQQEVDDILGNLFPGWRPRFPLELGWRFIPPAEIHVYDVPDVPGALAALRFIGFEAVVLHPHPAVKFIECKCMPRSPV